MNLTTDKKPIVIFFASTAVFILVFVTISFVEFKKIQSITNSAARLTTASSANDVTKIFSQVLNSHIGQLMVAYKQAVPTNASSYTHLREYRELDREISELFENTRILKAKVITDNHIIIYSSDKSEVLSNYRNLEDSEYVIHALRGRVSSVFENKSEIMSMSGLKKNVTTVSSYHPIVNAKLETTGVAEIYIDVSEEIRQLNGINKYEFAKLLFVKILLPIGFLVQFALFFVLRNHGRKS